VVNNKKDLSEYYREYRLKNAQKERERNRIYESKNRERIKERKHQYYIENKDTILEKNRKQRLKNSDITKEKQREKYIQKKREIDPNFAIGEKKYSWTDQESVRSFFEIVAKEYHIIDFKGWYRISRDQIKMAGGGGMFHRYGNLGVALKFAYPEHPWELHKFEIRYKESAQHWLVVTVRNLLPGVDVYENYSFPDLCWEDTGGHVEFDIWIPSLNLVLEYQGQYHSVELPESSGFASASQVRLRDAKKKEMCEKKGILYVAIDYWWKEKKYSLSSTLHQYLPDVFAKTNLPPIPPTLPADYKPWNNRTDKERPKKIKRLMQGFDYSIEHPKFENPKGWFMTEKFDGIRGYWDGTQFWSKNGNIINVPESFKTGLPNYHLDGEFWGGYEENEVKTILLKINCGKRSSRGLDWEKVKFCVFDAPQVQSTYDKRNLFIRMNIPKFKNNKVLSIPVKKCKGLVHLEENLSKIIDKGRKGIMLYRPDTLEIIGRTRRVLKVKKYFHADVKFLHVSVESFTLVCEQSDGIHISVSCKRVYFFEPPTQGTMIPVQYQGYFALSSKYKYPVMNTKLYEERNKQNSSPFIRNSI